MLANYLGYDFVGSDIKTSYAQQNAKRWMTTRFATPGKRFDIFDHDIKTELKGEIKEKNILIVTE